MIDHAGSGRGARPRARPPTVQLVELARHTAIVGLAGAATGILVGGVGGRIFMRFSAIAAPDYAAGASTEGGNIVGEITIGGTIGLVLFVGLFGGLVGAIAYLVAEPWLGWTGRWRGLFFGVLLLVVGSTTAFDPGNRDFVILDNQELNVAMLGALFIGFGLLIVPVIARLERSLPPVDPSRPVAGGWGYLALAAFGAQFLVLFFLQFFDSEASGAETAPVAVGIALMGVTAVTLVYWVQRIRGGSALLDRRVWVAGHALLLITAVLGTARAARDIGDILAL